MKETRQWVRLLRRHVFFVEKCVSKFIYWWNILCHKKKVKCNSGRDNYWILENDWKSFSILGRNW